MSMSKIAFQAFWFRGFCFLILCSVFKIPNHLDSYMPKSYLIQFRQKQSLDLDTQFHFSKGWSRHVKFSMNSCRPNSSKFFNNSLKKKISTYTYSMCELFCLNEFYINKSKSVAPGTILNKVVKNVRLGYKAGLSTIKILISLMRGKVSMDQSPLKPCFCPDATGQSSLPCS